VTTKELVTWCYATTVLSERDELRQVAARLSMLDEQVRELVELVRDCSECSVFMVKPALREFIKLHPELFEK
jgi:hypothetical protein